MRDLLKLMIHSLYSHREIFLRELISNASDANDRLRFAAIADPALLAEDPELEIRVDADAAKGTLTIRDNGIGMTREEVDRRISAPSPAPARPSSFARSPATSRRIRSSSASSASGSIPHSSSRSGSRCCRARPARRRRPAFAGSRAPTANSRWRPSRAHERGTTVTLHLKSDAREFADPFRLRSLIRRYSDHIGFPVRMPKEGEASLEYEVVNEAKALWTLPRTEITDEQYRQFYQHIAHDFTDPLAWSHNKVEGKREYTSLLYLPARAPFDLWQREAARGLKLYVRRVFIMDDAEQFLPQYLRFVKGIVDSSDLPLNVSRELLQQDPEVDAIRSGLTKRVLDMLARLAKEEPEKYATFWKEFGAVLKEGIAQDPANRDRMLPLLRFASTQRAGQRA